MGVPSRRKARDRRLRNPLVPQTISGLDEVSSRQSENRTSFGLPWPRRVPDRIPLSIRWCAACVGWVVRYSSSVESFRAI
ncbi:hypothetical protein VTN02DRAFT_6057 [Thermoascus thermophilus]